MKCDWKYERIKAAERIPGGVNNYGGMEEINFLKEIETKPRLKFTN